MTSDEPARPANEVPADAPSTAVGIPGPSAAPERFGFHAEVGLPAAAVGVPVRRGMRVSRPPRHPRWLVDQLPVGMVQSDFFVRFVALFQEVASTLLDDADLVEHIPDVTVTPAPMLQSLASWIGVDVVDASLPEQLQRTIVASSSRSLAHRGTVRGLRSSSRCCPADRPRWWTAAGSGGKVMRRRTSAGSGDRRRHRASVGRGVRRHDARRDPGACRIELWVGERRVLSTMEEERNGH